MALANACSALPEETMQMDGGIIVGNPLTPITFSCPGLYEAQTLINPALLQLEVDSDHTSPVAISDGHCIPRLFALEDPTAEMEFYVDTPPAGEIYDELFEIAIAGAIAPSHLSVALRYGNSEPGIVSALLQAVENLTVIAWNPYFNAGTGERPPVRRLSF